jgi:nucleoside 2-deoxyribosyltransferase
VKIVYVAGKFRGKTAWEVAENVRAAERVGFEVAKLGAMPLIPHANTSNFDGTLTAEFWLEGTMELLRRCDAVLTVDNWQQSTGATLEVIEAEARRMPVFHYVESLRMWLRDVAAAPVVEAEERGT